MALVIGVVSQKGGVGKSTLARLIACNYAASEWMVKIADMDLAQGTCTSWNRRRLQNEIEPKVFSYPNKRFDGLAFPPAFFFQPRHVIVVKGNKAIVSYNMRGAQYFGGIDVIDISNKSAPVLKSQALFQTADINSVSFDNGYVYAATATGDTGFPYPAVFEVIQLQGNNLVLNGATRLALTSFAGTGAVVSGNYAYATCGDNGGFSKLNVNTLTFTASVNLHDARWVDVAGGKIVVVQGTPGKISVFNETTLNPLGTFSFGGANRPESKSTVEVVGGKAFIAAGDSGVKILSASTGLLVGSVGRPNPDSLGLGDSVVVTNAVSVDGDLLYISNGEAGVYVAQGSQSFSNTGSEVQQQITMLGRLRFNPPLQSVNHVTYKNQYLIIAAGLGGLKIVELQQ